jgi:hypothetical protein
LKIITTGEGGQDALLPAGASPEQPGGIQSDESKLDSLENNSKQEGSTEWEGATVVITDSNTDKKPSRLIPQVRQRGMWDLPWNEDDLKHFKRVLIPDFELHERLSNASTLERLSMAYARLEAKSRYAVKDRLLISDSNLLKALLEYGENIFGISKHPSVSLLPRDVDFEPDWRTMLHFRALTEFDALTEESKQLFKETMILYHELRNYSHLKPVEQKWAKRYAMVTDLIVKSRALKTWLDQLFDIDYAWKRGGLLTTRYISQKVEPGPEGPEWVNCIATCLEVTENYIIFALDNGIIWIFDHIGTPLRSLHGHVMGVSAFAVYGDIIVSGSLDRDVRVWNIDIGYVLKTLFLGRVKCTMLILISIYRESMHTLQGHTSTVRCLTLVNKNTAVSGSRDATLRVWDIRTGFVTPQPSPMLHFINHIID